MPRFSCEEAKSEAKVAILQATLTTAYFNFVNRMALGLGVEDDDRDEPHDY